MAGCCRNGSSKSCRTFSDSSKLLMDVFRSMAGERLGSSKSPCRCCSRMGQISVALLARLCAQHGQALPPTDKCRRHAGNRKELPAPAAVHNSQRPSIRQSANHNNSRLNLNRLHPFRPPAPAAAKSKRRCLRGSASLRIIGRIPHSQDARRLCKAWVCQSP